MKLVYCDALTNGMSADQKKVLKGVKPKLRKPNRMLVTRRYEPQAYTYQKANDLVGRVINMYDFFQQAVDVPVADKHIRTSGVIDLSEIKVRGINPNTSELYYHGQKVAMVDIAPLTVQLIGSITWLSPVGDLLSRDIYDRRGFKSSTQYFHLDGSLGHQVMYNPDGVPTMEVIMMAVEGNNCLTGYKLLNYQGADYLFNNEDELWAFFKSELESEIDK